MYCSSCGSEITVELNYCKRCGANLALPMASSTAPVLAPIKLTGPTVVLGLTITAGLGIIFGGVTELARIGLHPAATAWIILFSMATLFGCTWLLIRFWSTIVNLQRETKAPVKNAPRHVLDKGVPAQLPPRFEGQPSVTENTTRTFAPVYREKPDPEAN